MTCAICGLSVGAGVSRDYRGDPVHYWCKELRAQAATTAAELARHGTPPRPRRQSTRRVRR